MTATRATDALAPGSADREHRSPAGRPARSAGYRAALAGLNTAQKPGGGVPAYTRWINRRLARYAAAAAYTLGWTPNGVTALSGLFSLVAITVLIVVPTSAWLGVLVALLLAAGYLLDSADGQVARLRRSGGPAGEWLDHVVDAVRTPAIHIAVLVGLWNTHQPTWALVVALCYCLVSVVQFMSQILAEQLSRNAKAERTEGSVAQSLVLLPTDTGTFCWIFLTWGVPGVFLVVYTVMFGLNTAHSVISMRRKYVHLRQVGASLQAAD